MLTSPLPGSPSTVYSDRSGDSSLCRCVPETQIAVPRIRLPSPGGRTLLTSSSHPKLPGCEGWAMGL
ncbi:unnamed protein product [Arctogadus glacialis]